MIALEPEAASIFSQSQPNVGFKELLKKGAKYLVVDNGGKFFSFTVAKK